MLHPYIALVLLLYPPLRLQDSALKPSETYLCSTPVLRSVSLLLAA